MSNEIEKWISMNNDMKVWLKIAFTKNWLLLVDLYKWTDKQLIHGRYDLARSWSEKTYNDLNP